MLQALPSGLLCSLTVSFSYLSLPWWVSAHHTPTGVPPYSTVAHSISQDALVGGEWKLTFYRPPPFFKSSRLPVIALVDLRTSHPQCSRPLFACLRYRTLLGEYHLFKVLSRFYRPKMHLGLPLFLAASQCSRLSLQASCALLP